MAEPPETTALDAVTPKSAGSRSASKSSTGRQTPQKTEDGPKKDDLLRSRKESSRSASSRDDGPDTRQTQLQVWNGGSEQQHEQRLVTSTGADVAGDIEGLQWTDLKSIRRMVHDHLLKGLLLVLTLIVAVSYLHPLILWANAPVAIVQHNDCAIHSKDYIQAGMVPAKFQDGFGKAAWMMPKLWETWSWHPPFQTFDGLMPLYRPSKAVLPREQIDRIDRAVKTYRDAVNSLEDMRESTEAARAVAAMERIVAPMLPCIDDRSVSEPFGVQIHQDTNASTVCKSKIFFRWHNFGNLAKILSNTGRLYDWTQDQIPPIEAAKADYLVNILDAVLSDRIRRLQHINHKVDRLEAQGTRSTVRHVLSYSKWYAAKHGMIDIMPVTTLKVFEDVRTLSASGEQHHFRAAACTWTQERMPLHVHCSCNKTKQGERWHVLRMTEEELNHQAQSQLRHYFWEELDYAKVHWDFSTEVEQRDDEGEIKWRWLDIRTHQSCRPVDSSDRPFNP